MNRAKTAGETPRYESVVMTYRVEDPEVVGLGQVVDSKVVGLGG